MVVKELSDWVRRPHFNERAAVAFQDPPSTACFADTILTCLTATLDLSFGLRIAGNLK